MTTTTERKLTPKQQRVMALLKEGLKPPVIAKRMKVTNAAIYGHMRAIRKAGHVIPGEEVASNGSTASTASAAKNSGTNVRESDAEETLRLAAKLCEEEITRDEHEVAMLEAKLTEVRDHMSKASADRVRYMKALEALAE